MKIEEYLNTLPTEIMNGENVELPERAIRDILNFGELQQDEIFCHIGCGSGKVLSVAAEYGAKMYGIEKNPSKANIASQLLGSNACIIRGDITKCKIPDADLILFWFVDSNITHIMTNRLATMRPGTRINYYMGASAGLSPLQSTIPIYT